MLIIIATCSLHHAACQHVQATSFTAKETEHSPQLRITDRSNSWHLHLPGAIQPARQIPGVTGVQSSYMAPKWLAAVVLLLGIPAVFASAGATVSVGARVRLQGEVLSWQQGLDSMRQSAARPLQSRQLTCAPAHDCLQGWWWRKAALTMAGRVLWTRQTLSFQDAGWCSYALQLGSGMDPK
jgi:hypothetical protein